MKVAAMGLALSVLLPPALGAGTGAGSVPSPAPRHLLVQVRDTAPLGPAAIRHGADGSYAVSTGGSGERDERGARAPDNAVTLSTSSRVRRVHILEGQRVRLDLPAVQSLQFHVPIPGGGAGKGAGSTGAVAGTAGGSGVPAASAVVYFEAVSGFAARFALAGSTVTIELTPLRAGTVAAPYSASAADAPDRVVTVAGRLGEWIALGDTDLQDPGRNLSATAEPTSPASVWVRVDPEAADAEH